MSRQRRSDTAEQRLLPDTPDPASIALAIRPFPRDERLRELADWKRIGNLESNDKHSEHSE